MRFAFAHALYQLLLPVFFVLSFPGWLVKMMKRGGFGSRLGERAGVYSSPLEWEPCGAVHVHAVSVGETLIALKLLRQWLAEEPGRTFVLATGTATGGKKDVKTPALRAFGRDLTDLAKKAELDPVIGRKNEIERVIQVLCRRTKNINVSHIAHVSIAHTSPLPGQTIQSL